MSPTRRAALLVGAVALCALALPLPVVILAEVVVLTATVIDALAVRAAPAVEQQVPSVLTRGVPSPLHLALSPTRGRPRVRQAVPPGLRLDPAEAEHELDGRIVALRRGRHRLPSPATRVVGPLGLGSWDHRPGEERELLVYPNLPAARRLALAVRRGHFRLDGRARGPLGLGTEFESVREYAPDDDLRQVNWRATARLGRPMSNQYRFERDRDVICLVDCGRLMAAPVGDRTRLDAAIDAAVSVAAVADELSDRVGAIAFDAEVRRLVKPRRRGGSAVVDALFDLEPEPFDSDYERVFALVGDAKRALVFVLTDLLEEAAARPLLEATPILSERHVVVVASVRDDELEHMARAFPASSLDVYRASVAVDVLDARARAAALLRRRGADVIEATPDRLGAVCVQSYLKAKARARL